MDDLEVPNCEACLHRMQDVDFDGEPRWVCLDCIVAYGLG